jgi:hypothetical protein
MSKQWYCPNCGILDKEKVIASIDIPGDTSPKMARCGECMILINAYAIDHRLPPADSGKG